MSIYDRNESIITDKLSFVKSKREKNSKINLFFDDTAPLSVIFKINI